MLTFFQRAFNISLFLDNPDLLTIKRLSKSNYKHALISIFKKNDPDSFKLQEKHLFFWIRFPHLCKISPELWSEIGEKIRMPNGSFAYLYYVFILKARLKEIGRDLSIPPILNQALFHKKYEFRENMDELFNLYLPLFNENERGQFLKLSQLYTAHNDPFLSRRSFWVLSVMIDKSVEPSLENLLSGLSNMDPDTRKMALNALRNIVRTLPHEKIAILYNHMLRYTSSEVVYQRLAAVQTLMVLTPCLSQKKIKKLMSALLISVSKHELSRASPWWDLLKELIICSQSKNFSYLKRKISSMLQSHENPVRVKGLQLSRVLLDVLNWESPELNAFLLANQENVEIEVECVVTLSAVGTHLDLTPDRLTNVQTYLISKLDSSNDIIVNVAADSLSKMLIPAGNLKHLMIIFQQKAWMHISKRCFFKSINSLLNRAELEDVRFFLMYFLNELQELQKPFFNPVCVVMFQMILNAITRLTPAQKKPFRIKILEMLKKDIPDTLLLCLIPSLIICCDNNELPQVVPYILHYTNCGSSELNEVYMSSVKQLIRRLNDHRELYCGLMKNWNDPAVTRHGKARIMASILDLVLQLPAVFSMAMYTKLLETLEGDSSEVTYTLTAIPFLIGKLKNIDLVYLEALLQKKLFDESAQVRRKAFTTMVYLIANEYFAPKVLDVSGKRFSVEAELLNAYLSQNLTVTNEPDLKSLCCC